MLAAPQMATVPACPSCLCLHFFARFSYRQSLILHRNRHPRSYWPYVQDAAVCVEVWALAAVGPDLSAAIVEALVAALSERVELPEAEETPVAFSALGAKAAAVVLGSCGGHLPGEVMVSLVRALARLMVGDEPPPQEGAAGGRSGQCSGADPGGSIPGASLSPAGTSPLRGAGALA